MITRFTRPTPFSWLIALSIALTNDAPSRAQPPHSPSCVEQAWDVTWNRFFHSGTETFMDYLSSYSDGRELAHLPSADEVKRQYPNPCGYSTGMEDGMILGGAMLSTLSDRYSVTADASLKSKAKRVFRGMNRCATVHNVPGFIARNVCVEDGESVYINSSRDQYTHFVHGLWKYYRSGLADDATKQQIKTRLSEVADRMLEFVTAENNYDFGRADGSRCPLGICRMWQVQAHEAARLPMIYAAAWDVTRNPVYHDQWRRYIVDACEQSKAPSKHNPAYALLQMQASLELLHQLEPEPELRAEIATTMQHVSELALERQRHTNLALKGLTPEQLAMLGPNWRNVPKWINLDTYPNPQWGEYRRIWHVSREAGEAALIPLMSPNAEATAEQRAHLEEVMARIDYSAHSSCGVIFHLAAYWKLAAISKKARRNK